MAVRKGEEIDGDVCPLCEVLSDGLLGCALLLLLSLETVLGVLGGV